MKNIQLIAPGSYVPHLKKEDLNCLSEQLKKLNYQLTYTDYLFEKKYFLAGTDQVRLTDLEGAFENPDTDVLLALRGGEGSMRLLDKINYDKIKKNPKPLIGFSDITALQNAIWTKVKLPSYTGFIGKFGFQKISPKLHQNLKWCLENTAYQIPIKTIQKGSAKGILLGGNLTAFCALLGTPFFPKMDGCILLLEEVAEPAYRLDRLLNQLRLAGVFDKIIGLVLGDMTASLDKKCKNLADHIIEEHLSSLKYPIVSLNGYSHLNKNTILPIGGEAYIDTSKNILCLDKIKKFH